MRKSYGVALWRRRKGELQIVMVKKRFTYQFFLFVYGKYKKNDDQHILRLLNNMTYREKICIANLNFSDMWSCIWLSSPENYSQNKLAAHPTSGSLSGEVMYYKKKSKFNANFGGDRGLRIRRLIDMSSNAEAIWEIPKGHSAGEETDMDAAMREFEEETGIQSYNIMLHTPPVVETYHDRTPYHNTYFLATCDEDVLPKVKFSSIRQYAEVECVKWVSLRELCFLRMPPAVLGRTRRLFAQIKSRVRKKEQHHLIDCATRSTWQ
jgi:8-oxo-dGTP pyrophosphatase MutT (NUDIX family)